MHTVTSSPSRHHQACFTTSPVLRQRGKESNFYNMHPLVFYPLDKESTGRNSSELCQWLNSDSHSRRRRRRRFYLCLRNLQKCSRFFLVVVLKINIFFKIFFLTPSPFLCFPSCFFVQRPCATEDGFVGLNWENCFTSSAYSWSPLPCCKTQDIANGTVVALYCHTIPPRFYLSALRSLFLFSVKRVDLLRGEEGLFLLLPLTWRLKERLMGESSPRKPG